MKRWTGLLLFLFSLISCASPDYALYDTAEKKKYPLKEGITLLPSEGYILLGETHYQEDIQKAQGVLIEETVKEKYLQNQFSVAWEFLNYPDQEKLEKLFRQYVVDQISLEDLLKDLIGKDPGKHLYYAPLFEAAKKFQGQMVATNAPRSWKSKIVAGGMGNLDAQKIPSNMKRGSAAYFDRFKGAMGGHGTPEQIENYFMAQSYTDAVMANSLMSLSKGTLTFMTVGHFHTDFGHGLPGYFRSGGNVPIVHVRQMDVRGKSASEIRELLKDHPKYGPRGDFIFLIEDHKP